MGTSAKAWRPATADREPEFSQVVRYLAFCGQFKQETSGRSGVPFRPSGLPGLMKMAGYDPEENRKERESVSASLLSSPFLMGLKLASCFGFLAMISTPYSS